MDEHGRLVATERARGLIDAVPRSLRWKAEEAARAGVEQWLASDEAVPEIRSRIGKQMTE